MPRSTTPMPALRMPRASAAARSGPDRRPFAADADFLLAARHRFGADGVADGLDDFRRKCLADDAADVVGLEDFLGVFHTVLPVFEGVDST